MYVLDDGPAARAKRPASVHRFGGDLRGYSKKKLRQFHIAAQPTAATTSGIVRLLKSCRRAVCSRSQPSRSSTTPATKKSAGNAMTRRVIGGGSTVTVHVMAIGTQIHRATRALAGLRGRSEKPRMPTKISAPVTGSTNGTCN